LSCNFNIKPVLNLVKAVNSRTSGSVENLNSGYFTVPNPNTGYSCTQEFLQSEKRTGHEDSGGVQLSELETTGLQLYSVDIVPLITSLSNLVLDIQTENRSNHRYSVNYHFNNEIF